MPDDRGAGFDDGALPPSSVPPAAPMISALGPMTDRLVEMGLADPDGPLSIAERPGFALWQVEALAGRHTAVESALADRLEGPPPGPGRCATAGTLAMMRMGPRRWWMVEEDREPGMGPVACERPAPLALARADGTTLDVTGGRVRLALTGPRRFDLIARLVSVDLSPRKTPEGTVVTTPLHGVPAVLVSQSAEPAGTHLLYLPQSQSRGLVELIAETAAALLL